MNKARQLLERALDELVSQDMDLRSEFETIRGWKSPNIIQEISEYLASEEQEKREPLRDMERPFIRLTDEEIREILGPFAGDPISGYTRKLFDEIQDKLEKVNGHR